MAFIVTWKPNVGASIVLNAGDYPIDESFNVDIDFSDPSAEKMQRAGEWPTHGYPGAARISCEGHIIGSDGTDFWTNRNAFLVALTPPNKEVVERHHGRLTLADDDMAEPMFALCRVVHRVANLQTLSPQRCPYLVTFKAFVPYLTGASSGREYLVG